MPMGKQLSGRAGCSDVYKRQIQSETKLGAERQESLSAPGITVPFFQVVSGLPPASDFLHRFAKPPGHSFGYVPVDYVDLRSLTKPARTEAAWIYLHNSDLPQSFAGFVKERKSTDSTGTYPKLCPGGFANRCRKSEAGGSPETT